MYIVGNWFVSGVQSINTQSLLDSAIVTNTSIIRRIRKPPYEVQKTHWRNGEISRENQRFPILPYLYTVLRDSIFVMLFHNKSLSILFRSRNTETLLGSISSSTCRDNFRSCSNNFFNGNTLQIVFLYVCK